MRTAGSPTAKARGRERKDLGAGNFCEKSSGGLAAISAVMRVGTRGAALHEGCEKLPWAGGRRLALGGGVDRAYDPARSWQEALGSMPERSLTKWGRDQCLFDRGSSGKRE